jgi:hypothetical protein
MKATRVSKVQSGRDYTIFGEYVFAFIDSYERGNCAVYEMKTLLESKGLEPEGIDFYGEDCYYLAGHGDMYLLEF